MQRQQQQQQQQRQQRRQRQQKQQQRQPHDGRDKCGSGARRQLDMPLSSMAAFEPQRDECVPEPPRSPLDELDGIEIEIKPDDSPLQHVHFFG